MDFSISSLSPPGKVTLVSPSGDINTVSPTYAWNAEPSASWYRLWVDDSTGNVIDQWYRAADCNCDSGESICSVTSDVELAQGNVAWWIRTWNAQGSGPWSDKGRFTLLNQIPAGTYYVAVDGNDTAGSGTYNNPWGTIEHALENVPDGSTILAKPGRYDGAITMRPKFSQGVIVRSEIPYRAQLRNNGTVIKCFYAKGITLEGFDIAHSGSGSGALVIQIQDLIGEPGGDDFVSRITLRNNILHDSYNNDILKINNGAGNITVEGNVFFNQTGSDEHIDVNSVTDVVIQDNIFLMILRKRTHEPQ